MSTYEICECTEQSCRFRFPAAAGELASHRCPWCGGQTVLRHTLPAAPLESPSKPAPPPSRQLAALVDNVRSTFNTGSIFRSADGAGLSHLYLCGVTPTPHHPKLTKTALGAEMSVPWSHHRNALLLAQQLQTAGHTLWALERTHPAPLPVRSIFAAPPLPDPLVLVLGSEVAGIDPDLLALCTEMLSIPMAGRKQSLNVAVAFGIAAFTLRHCPALPPTTTGG